MSKNVKIQTFFDIETYIKIMEYRRKYELKTDSTAIYSICKKYFNDTQRNNQAIENLNKVIQGYEQKIRDKNLEIRILKEKTPPKTPVREKNIKKAEKILSEGLK